MDGATRLTITSIADGTGETAVRLPQSIGSFVPCLARVHRTARAKTLKRERMEASSMKAPAGWMTKMTMAISQKEVAKRHSPGRLHDDVTDWFSVVLSAILFLTQSKENEYQGAQVYQANSENFDCKIRYFIV